MPLELKILICGTIFSGLWFWYREHKAEQERKNRQEMEVLRPKPKLRLVKKQKGEKTMKCEDCGSDDLHWLAWIDKDKKYIGESAYSENGEYWCNKCQEKKE